MISARLRPFMKYLVHGPQTNFIQDICILDNVFTFFEVVEWAKSTNRPPLAIITLDFAYDTVDWDFLEGMLSWMGFPPCWITSISILYRYSLSAITIGGFLGPSFKFNREVCQGCPLAPYLFLFFAEAMSHFLHALTPQIHGIRMSLSSEDKFLDFEFADETMLHV